MKTSLKWLKEYIDFEGTIQELSDKISLAGLEVESIEVLKDIHENVVVGEILSRNPHPNADKLSVCEVSDGSETFQVVCGAPNCDAGNKIPFAKIGSDFGDGFVIKKGKLRGEHSFGMLCSCDELGLAGDADGLLILTDEFELGKPLKSYFQGDYVFETEVTPNRPDWLSQIGIARELAAIENCSYRMPEVKLVENEEDVNDFISVEVQDEKNCPRYTARVIKDIKIGPSPDWMQECLISIGLRPINNVVDITNFVLMDCGQPLHAFDYDKISGKKIIVRNGKVGEKMPLLDGSEHNLTDEMLVIADGEKSVALAGVMGGGNSEIDEATTTVLLESACFDPSNIRATTNKLAIHSDSSYRFERGVDVEMVEFASARAAELMCKFAGGTLVKGMVDSRTTGPYLPHVVDCRFSKINSLLGVEIPQEKVAEIFTRLELKVTQIVDDVISVAIPSFRLDLHREVDLIEEVSRIFGLNNIPASPISSRLGGEIATDAYYPIQLLREKVLGLGLDECMTYSMINEDDAVNGTGFTREQLVKLSNPLSAELSVMRPSLIPEMLDSVARNISRQNHNLALFELGRVVCNHKKYAEERYEVCMAMTGLRHPERFSAEKKEVIDFYDIKGCVEGLMESYRIFDYEVAPSEHACFEDGICADLVVNQKVIGHFGQVDAEVIGKVRINHPLFMAVIDADKLMAIAGKPSIYSTMATTPSTSRDVSFIADESLTHRQVLQTITKAKVKILENVDLFDIFVSEKALGKGKKSMAYSFTYRHAEKTLNDKEVNKTHDKLVKMLQKQLPIEIR